MGRRIWLLCWLLLLPLSIWSGWEWAGGARWQIAMASIPVAGVGGTGENKVAKGTKSFECFCSGQLLESQVVNSSNISIMQSLSCLQSTTPCQKQLVGRLNSWRWSLRGYFLSEEEDLRLEKFGWYSEGVKYYSANLAFKGESIHMLNKKKNRKSELFQWHTNRKIKLSVPGGARLNHGNARTCSRRLMTIEHIAALSTRLLEVTTFKRMRMYFNRSCNITNIKERPTGKHIRCK